MTRPRAPNGAELRDVKARELIEQLPARAAVHECLVKWWTVALDRSPNTPIAVCSAGEPSLSAEVEDEDMVPPTPGVGSFLDGIEMPEFLRTAVVDAAHGDGSSRWMTVEADAACHLLAEALGASVARMNPVPGAIEKALRIVNDRRLPLDIARGALLSGMSTSGDRAEWETLLKKVSDKVADYFNGWDFDRESESVKREATQWRTNSDPFAVWNRLPRFSDRIDHTITFRLGLLIELNPTVWTEAVDRIPAPALKWSAIHSINLLDEPDLLVRVLTCAPKTFETDGEWTQSTTATLVAMALVDWVVECELALQTRWRCAADPTTHAAAQARHSEYRTKVAGETFILWFTEIARRSDGVRILEALLPRLITNARGDRFSRREWSASAVAHDSLAYVIATLDEASVRRVIDGALVARTGEGVHPSASAAFARLTAAALVFTRWLGPSKREEGVELGQPDRDLADRIWRSFIPVLASGDDDLGRELAGDLGALPSWLSSTTGFLLAHCSDPQRLWWESFSALEMQRHRWAYGRGQPHDDIFSLFTIQAAFMGILWAPLRPTATSLANARQYFSTVFAQARRLHLTRPSREAPTETTLAWSFGGVHDLFASDDIAMLREMMTSFRGSAEAVATAAYCIWKSGVELETVQEVVRGAGSDLEDIMTRVTTTRAFPAPPGSFNQIPPHFAELRRALADRPRVN